MWGSSVAVFSPLEAAVGLLSFCILLFVICPNCTSMKLFLVSYLYLLLEETFANRCKLAAAKGPRFQPV